MRAQTMINASQGFSATGVRTRTTRHEKTKKLQPRLECAE